MDEPIVEGQSSRPAGAYKKRINSRYGFSGTNPYDPKRGAPRLQFGERGELTPKTIAQAGLTGADGPRESREGVKPLLGK